MIATLRGGLQPCLHRQGSRRRRPPPRPSLRRCCAGTGPNERAAGPHHAAVGPRRCGALGQGSVCLMRVSWNHWRPYSCCCLAQPTDAAVLLHAVAAIKQPCRGCCNCLAVWHPAGMCLPCDTSHHCAAAGLHAAVNDSDSAAAAERKRMQSNRDRCPFSAATQHVHDARGCLPPSTAAAGVQHAVQPRGRRHCVGQP